MKKWMKVMLISGVALIFAGAGMTAVVGAVKGRNAYYNAEPIRRVVTKVIRNNDIDREYQSYFSREHLDDDYDDYEELQYGEEYEVFEDKIWSDWTWDDSYISPKSEMVQVASFQNVRELSVDAENASIAVVENPELKNEIVFYSKEKRYCGFRKKVEDGGTDVSIEYYGTTRGSLKNNTYAEGIIEVPTGYLFDKAEFNAAAGIVKITAVQAGELSLEASAGTIYADNFTADKLEVDAAAGAVRAKGIVNREMEADAEAGSIELTVQGTEQDFRYEIDCSMGEIRVGASVYAGFATEQIVNSGAAKKASLDCGAGAVKVSFY